MAHYGPIVAVGEVLWDILPQAAVIGGAPFNFAFHCHQLGQPVRVISRVGDDTHGRAILDAMQQHGMDTTGIQIDPQHPTGTVVVQLSPEGQPRYNIVENVAWDYLQADATVLALAAEASAICFGTLAQRSPVSRASIRQLLQAASTARKVLDLNLRPPFVEATIVSSSIALADWLKLNEDEFAWLRSMLPTCSVGTSWQFWREWLKLELLCVTRGERGCSVCSAAGEFAEPGCKVQVCDTIGAGDAFTAALLTQTLQGAELRSAVRFANRYAAEVAQHPGGTPRFTPQQIDSWRTEASLSP